MTSAAKTRRARADMRVGRAAGQAPGFVAERRRMARPLAATVRPRPASPSTARWGDPAPHRHGRADRVRQRQRIVPAASSAVARMSAQLEPIARLDGRAGRSACAEVHDDDPRRPIGLQVEVVPAVAKSWTLAESIVATGRSTRPRRPSMRTVAGLGRAHAVRRDERLDEVARAVACGSRASPADRPR